MPTNITEVLAALAVIDAADVDAENHIAAAVDEWQARLAAAERDLDDLNADAREDPAWLGFDAAADEIWQRINAARDALRVLVDAAATPGLTATPDGRLRLAGWPGTFETVADALAAYADPFGGLS